MEPLCSLHLVQVTTRLWCRHNISSCQPPHPSPLQWFDDAAPAVAHACNAAVSLLEAKGLKVVEIQVR